MIESYFLGFEFLPFFCNSPEQLLGLSEFAHLFDVAVAINLAYSLVRQVHDSWTQACTQAMVEVNNYWEPHIKETKTRRTEKVKELLAQISADENLKKIISIVTDILKEILYKHLLGILRNYFLPLCSFFSEYVVVNFSRILGFAATSILIWLLILIGFKPHLKVCPDLIWIYISTLVFPIPSALVFLLFFWFCVLCFIKLLVAPIKREINKGFARAQQTLQKTKQNQQSPHK